LYFIVTPCRLLDTRSGPPLSSGTTYLIMAAGSCEIPSGASEVVLNITVTSPTAAGGLTAYSGATVPPDPTLPFKAGQTRANNAIVMLDALGKFNLLPVLGGGTVHVIIDVQGYFVTEPGAVDDNYSTPMNTLLTVAAPGVLSNDTGTNLQAVPFSGASSHGMVDLLADGSFTYTPNSGFTGMDSFPYTVQNPAGSSSATVNVSVTNAPAITSANNTTFAPGKVGQSFLVTTTGTPTNTISRSGPLPSGVTFTDNGDNTATIAGTPASGTQGASPYAWTITAANGTLPNATQSFTFNVTCPAITVSGTIPTLSYNTAMSTATFTQGGGNGTIVWSQTGLPTGTGINSSNGQVTGTPTVTGTFSVTITATDAGGCTGSKPLTVMVAPVAATDSYSNLVDNTQAVVTGGLTVSPGTPFVTLSGSVLANDQPSGGVTLTAGTFATSAGGSVTLATDGTFIYTPKANPGAAAITSDSFTYIISSNTGGGAPVTAMGTVNLTLGGRVWYVNNSGSNGNGQSQSPFNSMTGADTASIANDSIFVYTGIGTTLGSTSLLAGQTLWGQGTTFTLGGLTIGGGTKPTLGGTVTLGGNNITVSSLDISTGSATGITNTGTISGVTIKNNVTVTTTTGTAVSFSNLDSTAGGAPGNGINFRSISANGGANGIVLSNVNTATGTFSVLGDGSNTTKGGNGSGGTIQSMTGADGLVAGNGIYLSSAKNVSLQRMQLNGFSNSAIRGLSVTGFTLQYSTISGQSGDSSGATEGPLAFGTSEPSGANGLLGTGLIDNCKISGGVENNMEFYNQSGTLNALTISNCDVKSNTVATGNDGILIESQGTASMTISVQSCAFDDNKSQAVQLNALDTSTADVTVNNCTLQRTNQGNEGFTFSNSESGHLTVHITNNTITGIGGVVAFVGNAAANATSSSTLSAVISGNTITHPASALNSAIIAFLSSTVGQSAISNVLIENNTVTENSTSGVARGILVDTPDSSTTPNFTATVTDNSVAVGDNVAGLQGVVVQARRGTGCFDVEGNTVTFPNGTPAGVVGVRARQASPGAANLAQGISGSLTASTVLAANNPSSTTEVIGTVTVVANGTCLAPPP
jgi:hypothetical protein